MNNFRIVFLGFLLTFATAWVGLAMLPSRYFATLQPAHDPATGAELPPLLDPLAQRGAQVYLANGCVYCHSQQVRPADAGSDIARGWGQRRTVARDYLRDQVAVMGTMRTGPDLANIGVRNPSDAWHLLHLYNPQLTSPGSTMPPFRFLFDKVKAGAQPRADALALPPGESTPGYEVIPSDDARALVAYLKALRRSAYALPKRHCPRTDAMPNPTPQNNDPGELMNVREVHGAILREWKLPGEKMRRVPWYLHLLYVALALWAYVYLVTYGRQL